MVTYIYIRNNAVFNQSTLECIQSGEVGDALE